LAWRWPDAAPDTVPAALSAERLTPLQRLESESIHILREAAAECGRPVLLYSTGKDSTALLRLARKPSTRTYRPSRTRPNHIAAAAPENAETHVQTEKNTAEEAAGVILDVFLNKSGRPSGARSR